jgi:3-oxocholest-4-en-26-oyl-CoA dehydrogenase alpha subunit
VDFDYSEDERAFQLEVRRFLEEHWDPEVMDPTREGMAQLVDTPKRRAFMREIAARGWLGMSWPEEYGGRGAAAGKYEYLLNEELAAVGAPYIGKGVGIVGKTLIRHGSEELKAEFLPKIRDAEIEFAIGYTEPEAGSDLASLRTKAVRDPDRGGWVINGQKRFTTSAHFAEWYWLAARTDADAPKHKGITLFLLPMDAPGITTHEMETIGDERVNEVFLDDVFVPDDQLVGEVNDGWRVARSTLSHERGVNPRQLVRHFQLLDELLGLALVRGGFDDPRHRQRLALAYAEVRIFQLHNWRTLSRLEKGLGVGPEGSALKLYWSEMSRRLHDRAAALLGPAAPLWRGADRNPGDGEWQRSYLYYRAASIFGGTNEIQRNIVAEQVLGLPRG